MYAGLTYENKYPDKMLAQYFLSLAAVAAPTELLLSSSSGDVENGTFRKYTTKAQRERERKLGLQQPNRTKFKESNEKEYNKPIK